MLRYLNRIISPFKKQFNFPIKSELKVNFMCNGFPQKLLCTTAQDSFYDVDFNAITNGNSELMNKLKVIMLEVDVLRQEGRRIPEKMSTEQWSEVLHASSRSQRIKHLAFWWLNDKKKENKKQKKLQKKLILEEEAKILRNENNEHIHYGFGGSTIFLRVYDTTMDRFKNWKVMQAMLFSQTLVIDCGYEKYMTLAELSNCAKQLSLLFSENRSHPEPFNLYFCNAPRENKLIMKLNKLIPTLYDSDFPLNITGKSYLEMFPKEKLVYLTPHCRENLTTYNEDDIYIIGGMVDKVNCEPLSLGKAKAEGIRMAKFPLDNYLDWGVGGKSLTINQSVKIMLDLRFTKDWEKALLSVPRRKLKSEKQLEYENSIAYKRNKRLLRRF